MAHVVNIDELKVGMYVHLDLSWVSHPFPRSSFLVDSLKQIDTIRSLGLKRLRWDPECSALERAVAEVSSGDTADCQSPAQAGDGQPPRAFGASGRSKTEQEAAEGRRQALALQRAVAEQCEEQYQEASDAWRKAFDRVRSQPHVARQETESLSRALRDKMLVEGEMCIRILNAASGDRPTAHAMNVAVLSMLLARMFDMNADELAAVGTGAMLHDVGKLDVPTRMRQRPEGFGATELKLYASHVEHGVAQARRMGLGHTETRVVAEHHELANGQGFPRRLDNEGMCLASRIVAVVNRFDNLCNPPLLSRAQTPHEALAGLFARSRDEYDALVLSTLIRMMGVYPAGSVVQLCDDRFAMVTSVNALRPLKPQVLVFDPKVPRDEALHLELAQMPQLGIRRSLRAAQLPPDALAYLAPRARMAYFFEAGAAPLAVAEAVSI